MSRRYYPVFHVIIEQGYVIGFRIGKQPITIDIDDIVKANARHDKLVIGYKGDQHITLSSVNREVRRVSNQLSNAGIIVSKY